MNTITLRIENFYDVIRQFSWLIENWTVITIYMDDAHKKRDTSLLHKMQSLKTIKNKNLSYQKIQRNDIYSERVSRY